MQHKTISSQKKLITISPKKRSIRKKKHNTVLAAWTKKMAGDRQEKRRETQPHAPYFPACPLPQNDIRIFPGKPLQQEKLLSFFCAILTDRNSAQGKNIINFCFSNLRQCFSNCININRN